MNKKFKGLVQGRVARASAVVGALALGAMSSAQAAIDITAETAAAKTDIVAAGAAIITVVVAVAAVGWVRRVIR